ncbi:hypothetical protein I4U23_004233 [Adineta vaga]|nr:hypothetical protein I4U23_004233 [Adineta vaga]
MTDNDINIPQVIYRKSSLVIALLLTIPYAMGHFEIHETNGCGAVGGFIHIDRQLREVGEGAIIPCCNAHDICYETCGETHNFNVIKHFENV